MLRLQTAFAVLACLFSVGCGPRLGQVDGKVTYKGEPVTAGTISFMPKASADQIEAGKPAFAKPDKNGEFQLTSFQPDDGAIVGTHVVTYTPPPPSSSSNPAQRAEEMKLHYKYAKLKLPQGYTVEVKSGRNEVKLELQP